MSAPASSRRRQDQRPNASAKSKDSGARQRPTPLVEWIVAAAGALLVATTLGIVLHDALRGDHSPPAVVLRVRAVEARPGGHLVRVEAANDGGSTAAAVEVEGELRTAGRAVETARAQIDYLPARSRREIGLLFTADPAAHQLTVRAVGYTEP